MTNRIVRALLGVALAKAAILGSWYLYQKAEKQAQEDKEEKPEADVAVKTEVATEEVEAVAPVVAKKTRARKPAVKAEKVEAPAKKVVAKKTTRKPAAKKAAPKADSAE